MDEERKNAILAYTCQREIRSILGVAFFSSLSLWTSHLLLQS